VFEDLGNVTGLTGQKKNRSYSYAASIALLAEKEFRGRLPTSFFNQHFGNNPKLFPENFNDTA
jgi:hypothetical protein